MITTKEMYTQGCAKQVTKVITLQLYSGFQMFSQALGHTWQAKVSNTVNIDST